MKRFAAFLLIRRKKEKKRKDGALVLFLLRFSENSWELLIALVDLSALTINTT